MPEYPEFICTLPVEQTGGQLSEWHALRVAAVSVEDVPNGVTLTLPVALASQVQDLAEREAECCAFLNFVTVDDGEHIRLDITSEVPGADEVIAMLVAN